MKVMVVEDQKVLAQDAQSKLAHLGYEISSVVPSGEDALEEIPMSQPDVILMDVVLHGHMDGLESAREIYSRYHLPVVFYSSSFEPDTLKKIRGIKNYGVLLKPAPEEELYLTIERAVSSFHVDEMYVGQSHDALIVTDSMGRVKHMNQKAENLTGFLQDDVRLNHIQKVFNVSIDKQRNMTVHPMVACFFEKEVIHLPQGLVLTNSDGLDIPVKTYISTIKDNGDDIIGFAVFFDEQD